MPTVKSDALGGVEVPTAKPPIPTVVVAVVELKIPFANVPMPVAVMSAAPMVPVNVGPAENTALPVPVSSVSAVMRFAEDGVASHVAMPVPRPEIPVETGRPVALVSVAEDGVPSAPSNVTNAPAEPTFTASAVATPVPKPEIPVETGSPVALVRVTEVGVPRIGVTNVGEVEKTSAPLPVSSLSSVASAADVVSAETTPAALVCRTPEGAPRTVKFVVEAVPKKPTPEAVKEVVEAFANVTFEVVSTFWSMSYSSFAPWPVSTVANVGADVVRTFWSIA